MANSQDRLMLPWSVEEKENRQFAVITVGLFIVFLIFAIWIPMISLPEPDRETLEKLPPQLAKLVVKKEPPKPIKKEAPKPEEPKEEPPKEKEPPKPKEKPVKKEVKPKEKPVEKPKVKQTVKQAREVARKTGLLALQNDLAELKSAVDVSALKKKPVKTAAKKTIAAKAKDVDAKKLLKTSGGIQTEAMAVPAESIELAGRSATELEQTADERALAIAEAEAALRQNIRSDDSIRLAFELAKKALYKLYNRELRKNPFIEGLVSFEVVIEPSGEVSYCRVLESELDHPELERKFVNRIKLHNFGPEEVGRITTQINIDFQPN